MCNFPVHNLWKIIWGTGHCKRKGEKCVILKCNLWLHRIIYFDLYLSTGMLLSCSLCECMIFQPEATPKMSWILHTCGRFEVEVLVGVADFTGYKIRIMNGIFRYCLMQPLWLCIPVWEMRNSKGCNLWLEWNCLRSSLMNCYGKAQKVERTSVYHSADNVCIPVMNGCEKFGRLRWPRLMINGG